MGNLSNWSKLNVGSYYSTVALLEVAIKELQGRECYGLII